MDKFIFSLIFVLTCTFQSSAQSLLKDGKIPDDLAITLERTACLGECPTYKLVISSNGSVNFQRIDADFAFPLEHISKNGTDQISQEKLKEVILAFEKAKFFKLKKHYVKESDGCKEIYTNHSGLIISIQIGGKKKTVSCYLGCGKFKGDDLFRIAEVGNKIDEITNSKQWIGKK